MNIGITTSFVVGGLLLLSILQMTFTVGSNATETTLQLMAKENIRTISQTLNNDFSRMGYIQAGNSITGDVINNSSNSTKIIFQADIDNSTPGAETITWEFLNSTSGEYSSSPNPNDYQLKRTGPVSSGNVDDTIYPVVDFKLTYFDRNGNDITSSGNKENVRKIKVEVLTESPDAISTKNGTKRYGRSHWSRTITPPSLQFNTN